MTSCLRRGSAALLLASVGVLTACGTADLAPGDSLAVSSTADLWGGFDGVRAQVWLPEGRLDLVVTEGLERVPADAAGDFEEVSAESDAAMRGVEWRLSRGTGIPSTQLTGAEVVTDEPHPVVTVVAGDVRRRVVGEDESDPVASAWVAVPDSASVTVEVEYDGLVQVIDADTGDLSPTVASIGPRGDREPMVAPCRQLDVDVTADVYSRCSVEHQSNLPYLPGQGWAAKGREWVVVSLTTNGEDLDGTKVVEIERAVTLDGTEAVAVISENDDPEAEEAWKRVVLAFEVPDRDEHALEVRVDYRTSGADRESFALDGSATLVEELEL